MTCKIVQFRSFLSSGVLRHIVLNVQTDGQTDGRTLDDRKDRACIASRGNTRSSAIADKPRAAGL